MTMIGIIRDRMLQPTSAGHPPVLRDGQIVQGEIIKIYPNNRAEIQIGSNKMIAEITTSLSVGKKYFFQVQAANQVIQLKVIGDHLRQENSQNILNLMNQLGLKVTKANMQFIQMLVNEKIPFNQEQLQQALQILDTSTHKSEAMSVLKEMLLNRLPMTNNVFHALSSNQNSTISPLLHQLITELTQLPQLNDSQRRLLTLLENLVARPLSTELAIAQQIMNHPQNSESLLHALKVAGLVDSDVNLASWNTRLERFFQANGRNNYPLETIWNNLIGRESQSNHSTLSEAETAKQPKLAGVLQQTFSQLVNGANAIQNTVRKIMSIFHQPLQLSSFTPEQFTTFRNMIVEQLLPLLPDATKAVLLSLLQQNRPEYQTQITQILQALASQETYQMAQNIVTSTSDDSTFLQQPVQKQLLAHINQFVQTIGLADENVLKTQLTNAIEQGNLAILENKQADTVKSLLMQMMQQENLGSERVQQMIHFINGMQLQSVQESNNFIHATLQIPGEKLALNQDIFMQFEGKKTENGQIDPDFCRILFVLHLQKLQETIIDMHVQKRIISVTIFNDSANLSHNIGGLRKMLAENLKKLDYHLSSITWKPLHEQKQEATISQTTQPQKEQERFDFLI